MASLLGVRWVALRGGIHRWGVGGLALIFGAGLFGGSAEAFASDGPISVSTRQTAASTAAVSGSSMAISTSAAVSIAMTGVAVASVVLPMGRVLTVGADVVAAAARMGMRSGAIQAAGLAAILASLNGDVTQNPDGSLVVPPVSANAGDAGFDGYVWTMPIGGGKTYSGNSPLDTCKGGMVASGTTSIFYDVQGNACRYVTKDNPNNPGNFSYMTRSANCISGYVKSGSACTVDPNAPRVPATDAQIEAAVKAHPASWPQTFNAAGCGKANSFMDAASADLSNDPCAVIIVGSVPQSNGVTWPNGNTATFPARSTTTAGTDADGRPTTTTTTTTTSATLSGTGSRTQPVSATPTQTTTTVTNRTNADGSTTSTTTTSTTTSPDQSSTDDQAATFNGPDIQLYKQKSKTFADVLTGFRTRVAAMPWYVSMVGFFNVSIAAGSCPHWAVPATRWSGALDASPYFCGATAMQLYQLGGIVVMIVAAWAAFCIAFL